LGHFGKQRTFAKICRRYFWHNRAEDVKTVVKLCQQCQMVKKVGNIRFEDERLKRVYLFVNYFIGLPWTLEDHYLKQIRQQIYFSCH
jgi:hypothetical protein